MPYSLASQDGVPVLTLEGAMTIRHAQDLAAALTAGLAEALDAGVAPRVDTSGLEDVDTCILQVLCSLRKSASGLRFDTPSRVFKDAVERCGLRRELLGPEEDA